MAVPGGGLGASYPSFESGHCWPGPRYRGLLRRPKRDSYLLADWWSVQIRHTLLGTVFLPAHVCDSEISGARDRRWNLRQHSQSVPPPSCLLHRSHALGFQIFNSERQLERQGRIPPIGCLAVWIHLLAHTRGGHRQKLDFRFYILGVRHQNLQPDETGRRQRWAELSQCLRLRLRFWSAA